MTEEGWVWPQRAAVHSGLRRLSFDLLDDPVLSFLNSSSDPPPSKARRERRGGGGEGGLDLAAGRRPKMHLFIRRGSGRCDINLPWEKGKCSCSRCKEAGRSICRVSGTVERLGLERPSTRAHKFYSIFYFICENGCILSIQQKSQMFLHGDPGRRRR